LPENTIETDVLIIGGGIAGCFAAIKAKEHGVDVTLVDKGYIGRSGATPFGGAYLTVFNPEWGHDMDAWMNQISYFGEYVNNPEWNKIVFQESYARLQDMISWGVECYKQSNGEYVFWPPKTPEEMAKFPLQAVKLVPRKHAKVLRAQAIKTGAKLMDRIQVTDLLKQDGKVVGAIGISTISEGTYIFKAKATVIAAGAAAFKPNGAPLAALTGDGQAMAYRAGAEITGKEWNDVQPSRAEFPSWKWHIRSNMDISYRETNYKRFYPKVNSEGDKISYGNFAVINYDDVFEADAGRAPIFHDYGSDEAIYRAIVAGTEGQPRKQADLDADKLGRVRVVLGNGLGMSVHMSEGIWPINTDCATRLPGLYAAGESCGARIGGSTYYGNGCGFPGASTTGAKAGIAAAEYALKMKKSTVDGDEIERLKKIVYAPTERKGGFSPSWVTQILQNTMVPYWVLYVKHEARLKATLTQIEFIRDRIVPKLTAKDAHELRLAHETKNMVLCAEMKLHSSLFRTESRGTHYREDYPHRDDPGWLAWVKIYDEQGEMTLSKEPIPEKYWPNLSLPYEERYPFKFPGE